MGKKNIIVSNLIWRFLERCGAQGVTFIVSIILARLLEPSMYGTVALITVFTSIMQVFVDSGMGNALIQKKDTDDLDFSSVFYFNICMCTVLYFLMFLLAPYISDFYELPELVSMIRVLSLIIVISGVKNVQQAFVTKNLLFKKFFFSTLGGTICAAIVGIIMAYLGFGVWALIVQMLLNTLADTVILWITVKWRPIRAFSMRRLKSLFSFGGKLLVSAIIETIYSNMQQLIIGKVYTRNDLAQYNQGEKFPYLIVKNINSSIDSVLLPILSEKQDSVDSVKSMTRKAVKISTFVMMPVMVGIAVCATSFVSIVLTDKWMPCVPFIRIFCLSYAFWPVHTANLNAIMAMGRSDLYLRLQIIKKSFGLVVLLISMHISVMAMAYGVLITTFFSQIVNSWPNRKLLNYSYYDQLKDMMPQISLSIVMGIIVYSIELANFKPIFTIIIQVPLGIGIYLLGSKVFKIDSFTYLTKYCNEILNKNREVDNE